MNGNNTIVIFAHLPGDDIIAIEANVGMSLMSVLKINNMNIEALCGGNLSCSTCMVFIKEPWYSLIPAPSDEELMMLDTCPTTNMYSRLSCQVILSQEMDGMKIFLE